MWEINAFTMYSTNYYLLYDVVDGTYCRLKSVLEILSNTLLITWLLQLRAGMKPQVFRRFEVKQALNYKTMFQSFV